MSTLDLLYYSDKVTVLNQSGHIGILTLWSRTDVILKKLGELPPSVAAISPLYGDGISQLIANLLWNQQISKLFIVGNNRTGSLEELVAYFNNGLEEIQLNGSTQKRIRGTTRLVNQAIPGPEAFESVPEIVALPGSNEHIFVELGGLVRAEPIRQCENVKRFKVELIEPKVSTFPSHITSHQVVANDLLDAWAEVLFVIHRYGLPVKLLKGDRKEIENLKVVITNPGWLDDQTYERYNLSRTKMEAYANTWSVAELTSDTSYSYGHRLHSYFGYDFIERAFERLSIDREDRKCYFSLWDTILDPYDDSPDGSKRGHPCWVSLYFRIIDNRLFATSCFRAHRAFSAWIENAHGLMVLQSGLAKRLNVEVGHLTIVSLSISIDPAQLSLVESILGIRKWTMRDDGRGEIVFSLDGKKIVVEHKSNGLMLKRYEGSNAEALSHKLAQDYVVSDLSHALYVGRQLGKLQMCLDNDLPYVES